MHEKAFVNHKNFDIEIGGNLLMTCFSRCENGRKKTSARVMKPERQAEVDSIPPAKAGFTPKKSHSSARHRFCAFGQFIRGGSFACKNRIKSSCAGKDYRKDNR